MIQNWHVEATGQELPRNKVPGFLNTSMRKEWTASNVIGLGVFPIVETLQPEITTLQKIEPGERIKVGDEYHRTWNVVDKTQEEIDSFTAQEAAQAAEVARQAAKAQAYIDGLPSWQTVSDALDGITTIAGIKVFLKKLSRVVYWDVKDTEE